MSKYGNKNTKSFQKNIKRRMERKEIVELNQEVNKECISLLLLLFDAGWNLYINDVLTEEDLNVNNNL